MNTSALFLALFYLFARLLDICCHFFLSVYSFNRSFDGLTDLPNNHLFFRSKISIMLDLLLPNKRDKHLLYTIIDALHFGISHIKIGSLKRMFNLPKTMKLFEHFFYNLLCCFIELLTRKMEFIENSASFIHYYSICKSLNTSRKVLYDLLKCLVQRLVQRKTFKCNEMWNNRQLSH